MSWLGQARKRNQRLGNIAWDTGLNIPRRLDLRNSGYLARLRLTQSNTQTYAAATPTANDAFAAVGGPLGRITVQANSVGLLYDCSGFMAGLVSAVDNTYRVGQPSLAGATAFTPFGSIVAATPFTNTWLFDIPHAIDLYNKPWPLGFFQTALNSQETSIELRYLPDNATAGAPGSGVYVPGAGALSAASGSTDIQQIYFDPIADPASQPNLGFIHQWREFQAPLTADGDTEIRLPPSNYYLRVIYAIVTGAPGALALDSTHLTRLRLMYGANLAPYDEPTTAAVARAIDEYLFTPPAGCYFHDFIDETHTERDWINSAATTDLRSVLTLSGATYTGGAYVKLAVEQMIPLQVPAPGTAGVQGTANVAAPA